MKFDIFFSICQTDVDGYFPSERVMFENFFDQVKLADELGFGTAWIAETHLSCEVQKQNPNPVIPDFKGEIGLNTDILQMAHKVFAVTKKINIGSAIMNILCNGGPIAHAEAIRTFLSLHGLNPKEKRRLNVGFAAGRFPFSNIPYSIVPRNKVEKAAWPVLRNKIFQEAVEIFLRLLKGETIASKNITPKTLSAKDFRTSEDWDKVIEAYGDKVESITIPSFWTFDKVGLIPKESPLNLLDLTIGSHDPETQALANKFLPCGVFNLSITPSDAIEKTHQRMKNSFHPDGSTWSRSHMPRTVLIFIHENSGQAQMQANKAIANYWKAMEGTLDLERVKSAVGNALAGTPTEIVKRLKEKYHPDERLMLWFDFNNHNNEEIKAAMTTFMKDISSKLPQ